MYTVKLSNNTFGNSNLAITALSQEQEPETAEVNATSFHLEEIFVIFTKDSKRVRAFPQHRILEIAEIGS